MRRLVGVLSLTVVLLSTSRPAGAVILYDRVQRNVLAPRRTLLNSGWQWQGKWGDFLGTAISRRFFVTAEHIGGKVGDSFLLNGVTYRTTATYDDPQTDLQVWKVDRDFPNWAPLFKENSEKGRGIILFGRGTKRGADVVVNNQLKGWLWDGDDGVQSWGKNIVSGLASSTADPEAGGAKIAGARLYWTFDRNGISYEGTVSSGDSGGGVFVKVGKTWKLVGVNHSAEAEFSYPGQPGTLYRGSLFDVGGLQNGDTLIPDQLADNPSRAYATRISPRVPWIYDVVSGRMAPSAAPSLSAGVPEPSGLAIVLGAMGLMRRTKREIRMPKPE